MDKNLWHSLDIKEIVKILDSDLENGLSEKEAEDRLKKFGLNRISEEEKLASLKIFLNQFKSPLIYILVIAGIITIFLKDYSDSIIIFLAVFINTIIGFFQEYKAEKTLLSLKKVVKEEAKVLRDGELKIIDSEKLVPGDIILLNLGDKVPADGRVIESFNLKINESILTGESEPSEKKIEPLPKDTILADRENMVYMGTIVEDGRGMAIVTETGINTEIGKISEILKKTKKEKTPYQKIVENLSKTLGIIILSLTILIFILGIINKHNILEMFIISVAVSVAGIPEGLPIAITVILVLGMKRILDRKGLVRKLSAAETLGNATIIATDKTGTLTEGKMKAIKIIGDEYLTIKAAVLASCAFLEKIDDKNFIIRGSPTEKAIVEKGLEKGINKRNFEKNKIFEIPFDSIKKFSGAIYKEGDKNILYLIGAPEKILDISNLEEKEKWLKEFENLAKEGLRVVGVATKELEDIKDISNLNFLGLIALKDPIRKDVKETMNICKDAGLNIIIVTGDHRLTAKKIGEELGLEINEENILEGKDLDKLSDEEFEKILGKIKIYARVEPRHKLKIVSAFQKRGEVIAMTGDGVNDAIALKKADIGVALGSAIDVAKEASDLILLNDSFSIIVSAIEEGRRILDNIRKVIVYFLANSFTELILIGVSILANIHLPITAAQILWANLIEDSFPALALGFEKKEEDVLRRRYKVKNLFTKEMKALIFIIGFISNIILVGLTFYLIFKEYELDYLRTIIFAMLVIDMIFYIFSCKNLNKNIWHINIFDNKFLILGWIFSILTLLAGIYLKPLNFLLKTVPLNFNSWIIIISFGILNLFLIEITKYYFISRKIKE
ncbi:MAG: cation-translocating P-type ATPase [Minisyncoccia bacterium]